MSLIINEMAEKLCETNQKKDLTLQIDLEKEYNIRDIQELKKVLAHMKSIEEQVVELLSKIENKKM